MKAAEKVRDAQKAVIKCLLHESEAVTLEDEARFAEKWQELEEDREYWDMITTDEIIDRYEKINQRKEVEVKASDSDSAQV